MSLDVDKFYDRASQLSMAEEMQGELAEISCSNAYVSRFEHPEKGIYFFESKAPVDAKVMILSSGLHGDELAGIEIMDVLRAEIFSGKLELRKHVLFIDGNLKAMQQALTKKQQGMVMNSRYFDGDASYGGLVANANRQWVVELLEKLSTNGSYASRRQWEIWKALNEILKGGTDTQDIQGAPEHLDLHQSFKVPKVSEVRGEYQDESEYTYAMVYASLKRFRQKYGDVFAGAVISESGKAETFAGITAREFRAQSITAELGTIGNPNDVTFADKMLASLWFQLQGGKKEVANIPMDVWQQVETILREEGVQDFGFYETLEEGKVPPPQDFVPLEHELLVPKSNGGYYKINSGQSLLFAKDDVGEGDRAGVVIERFTA